MYVVHDTANHDALRQTTACLAYLVSLVRFRQAALRDDFAGVGLVCFRVDHFIAFREASLKK